VLLTTSPAETISQRRIVWLGYTLCLIAAVIIWGLVAHAQAAAPTDPFGLGLDVAFYLREGQQIRGGGLFAFNSTVHAYGYPLFVSLCLAIAETVQQPVTVIATYVQFALHVAAAWLALQLFIRLHKQPSIGQRIGVFFVLVCNPLLLMATFYLLSDSVTVFWLTLALAAGLSNWRGRWWIVGLALGVCIVTRPFHQIWIIIVLIGLLATLTFFRWVQRYRVHINSGQIGRTLIQMLVPLLLLVGTQYLITYQQQGVWSIVGGTGNKAIQIHITGSLYYYRYETLLRPDGYVSGVRYYNNDVRERIAPIAIEEPSMVALYIEQLRADPLSLPLMALIKAVGLFQHYDLRMFLSDLGIVSPLAFALGLVMFILFVTIVQEGLLQALALIRQRPRGLKLTPSIVLFWVIVTYVVLYAIATAPEPRFIFPIFPAITILGLHIMSQPRPLWQRVSAPIIASVLYGIAAFIILPAATLG